MGALSARPNIQQRNPAMSCTNKFPKNHIKLKIVCRELALRSVPLRPLLVISEKKQTPVVVVFTSAAGEERD